MKTEELASTADPLPTADVLGVPICTLTFEETVTRLNAFVTQPDPSIVITADASGLVLAKTDSRLADIYRGCALATPDSFGVIWALKRHGHHGLNRVSGVDLVESLCDLSAKNGYRIFLLGSEPGVAEKAAERLRLKHPGCLIVGTRHGFFPEEDNDLIAAEIAPF